MMRIVLAFSGGLRPSAAIPWLKARHRADVVAVIVDLGRGRALEAVRDRARAAGAVRAHVVDAREAFAREFVLPSLRADAVSVDGVPQPRALGRPAIGRALVEIARIERAVAVAHGAEAQSPDAVRIESAVTALDPGLAILRPAAEWEMSREALLEYARAEHVPVPSGANGVADVNLWGSTFVPDGARAAGDAFALTPAQGTPRDPAVVDLAFEMGVPTGINGVAMPLIELIQALGTISGAHGIGRVDRGGSSVEAPAALVLHAAHRALRQRMFQPEVLAFGRTVSLAYAGLIDRGGWFGPLRDGLDAFVSATQRTLSGTVRLSLFNSTCEALETSATPEL